MNFSFSILVRSKRSTTASPVTNFYEGNKHQLSKEKHIQLSKVKHIQPAKILLPLNVDC